MRLSQRIPTSFRNINLPSTNRCKAKAKELQAVERSVSQVEVTPARLVGIVRDKSGSELTYRERRALPYFILDARFEEFNPKFGIAVLRNFSEGRTFWTTLFNAWLFHYDMDSTIGKIVRKALNSNRSRLSKKMLELDARFNILGAKPDFQKTASSILAGEITPEALKDINFSGDGVSGGRFSLALLSGFAKHCMSGSLVDSQLNTLVKFLCPNGSIHESVRDVALVSLIYSIEKKSRDSEIFLSVKEIIDNNFQDPRIDSHQWPAISEYLGGEKTREHCIAVVKQWYIFQSISLFFKLIEEVVEGGEHKHHFPQRRQFWIDYFDKGLVSDARVILGRKGTEEATRYQQSGDPDFAKLSWANLTGGGRDQCVLLMQIGGAKVVEWSHSGACRVWASNDGNSPMMSRSRYSGSDLRAALADETKDRIIHDPSGAWKSKIAQRVNSYSGLRRFL